jgi:hypothetical protein
VAKQDPNKYSKNANISAESKLSVLLAFLRVILTLVGIFGISYELFREHGWLSMLLGNIVNPNANMLIVALVLVGLWQLYRWSSATHKQDKVNVGDILMYAMMAVGMYYSYHLLNTGRLMFLALKSG